MAIFQRGSGRRDKRNRGVSRPVETHARPAEINATATGGKEIILEGEAR